MQHSTSNKTSESLDWFTVLILSKGFAVDVWCFGTPGHGKGVWDGLGGMLKNWLRRQIIKATFKPGNKSLLTDARSCSDAIKGRFGSEKWREGRSDHHVVGW